MGQGREFTQLLWECPLELHVPELDLGDPVLWVTLYVLPLTRVRPGPFERAGVFYALPKKVEYCGVVGVNGGGERKEENKEEETHVMCFHFSREKLRESEGKWFCFLFLLLLDSRVYVGIGGMMLDCVRSVMTHES